MANTRAVAAASVVFLAGAVVLAAGAMGAQTPAVAHPPPAQAERAPSQSLNRQVQVCLLRISSPEEEVPETYYWLNVTQSEGEDSGLGTTLSFMVGSTRPERKLVSSQTTDTFLEALLPNGDSSSVVTVWDTGSVFRTIIFGIHHDNVSVLLDQGTHLPPEFPMESVLFNTGWIPIREGCCTASETEIWLWAGKNYRLAKKVPFAGRYRALQELEGRGRK